jgi:hypothetical protein
MHMTFGRLGAVDRQAKMSGMQRALPATWRLLVGAAVGAAAGIILSVVGQQTFLGMTLLTLVCAIGGAVLGAASAGD